MADENPHDQVFTYVINVSGGCTQHYDELKSALGRGYRVVDIIQTPQNPGSGSGTTVVTVLVTLPGKGSMYKAKLNLPKEEKTTLQTG